MNRADRKRLADLRDRQEMAELEILTSRVDEITDKFNPERLTVGQILVVSDLMNSVGNLAAVGAAQRLRKAAETAEASAGSGLGTFAPPRLSERRSDTDSAQVDDEADDGTAALREALARLYATRAAQSETWVRTVNGPVPMSEVPRGEDGRIDPTWIDANCMCDAHERQRTEAADRARGGYREEYEDDSNTRPGLGQYV